MKYQLTEEILLLQKRAGIISESEYQEKLSEVDVDLDDKEQSVVDDVKDKMSAILKSMDTELAKASKSTNESIITIASIAIALPAVMGLISKFGKAAGNYS
jgi:excinuclease UvrABC nuclease subunit